MNQLRVAILEPNRMVHEDLKSSLTLLFNQSGYTPLFGFVETVDHFTSEVVKSNFDVFVCDISLEGLDGRTNDRNNALGLRVIQTVKKEYPDVFCIGCTAFELDHRLTAVRRPGFDMFLRKDTLFSQSSQAIVPLSDEFSSHFQRYTDFLPPTRSNLDPQHQSDEDNREIVSIISQVLSGLESFDERLKPSEVQLEEIGEGMSRSSVYRLTLKNGSSNIDFVPAVLKVSVNKYAQREYDNYLRFVRWLLPFESRAELLGTGFSRHWGGICYAFVRSNEESFESLTTLLKRGKYDIAVETIDKLFSLDTRRWYHHGVLKPENGLSGYYRNRFFSGSDIGEDQVLLSEDGLNRYVQEAFVATVSGHEILVNESHYRKPSVTLFSRHQTKYESVVCHGDLNSSNVIVAENGEFILIDFQDTGRGHVFEDFISMELSLRLYGMEDPGSNFDQADQQEYTKMIFDAETQLNQSVDSTMLPQPYSTIHKVRRHAALNFPNEPFSNYYFGLAAMGFRLLRIDILSKLQAQRLIPAILISQDIALT